MFEKHVAKADIKIKEAIRSHTHAQEALETFDAWTGYRPNNDAWHLVQAAHVAARLRPKKTTKYARIFLNCLSDNVEEMLNCLCEKAPGCRCKNCLDEELKEKLRAEPLGDYQDKEVEPVRPQVPDFEVEVKKEAPGAPPRKKVRFEDRPELPESPSILGNQGRKVVDEGVLIPEMWGWRFSVNNS